MRRNGAYALSSTEKGSFLMKIRSKTFAVPALLASAMTFGSIMPAQAQTSNPQAQTSNPQTQERVKPQGQVSDSELQSFAVAALKVQDISNQWRPKIAGAQDAQQEIGRAHV